MYSLDIKLDSFAKYIRASCRLFDVSAINEWPFECNKSYFVFSASSPIKCYSFAEVSFIEKIECFERVYPRTHLRRDIPPRPLKKGTKKWKKKTAHVVAFYRSRVHLECALFFICICFDLYCRIRYIDCVDFYGHFNQNKNSLRIIRQRQHLDSILARRFLSSGFLHCFWFLSRSWLATIVCVVSRNRNRDCLIWPRQRALCVESFAND